MLRPRLKSSAISISIYACSSKYVQAPTQRMLKSNEQAMSIMWFQSTAEAWGSLSSSGVWEWLLGVLFLFMYYQDPSVYVMLEAS